MSEDLSYLNNVLAAGTSSQSAPTASSTLSSTSFPNAMSDLSGRSSVLLQSSITDLQPFLDALRISAVSEDELSLLDDANVSTLLQKMDQADLASGEVEKRLDSLLGELDGMLETLEGDESNKPSMTDKSNLMPNGKLVATPCTSHRST